MADKKADKKGEEITEQPSKKSGLITSIIAIVILSAVAVGAGWFVASQNKSSSMSDTENKPAKKVAKKKDAHGKEVAKEEHGGEEEHGDSGEGHGGDDVFTKFEPFIVNLPRSNNSLIRLELGMLAENDYSITSAATQAEIVDEISTYLKTIELKFYSGPSGYLHLREDLLERAQLTSKGKVRKVFILSMAVE